MITLFTFRELRIVVNRYEPLEQARRDTRKSKVIGIDIPLEQPLVLDTELPVNEDSGAVEEEKYTYQFLGYYQMKHNEAYSIFTVHYCEI